MRLVIPETETYYFTRWVFLRLLGIIYFVAFVSLGVQITGLIGREGILPAHEFLDAVFSVAGKTAHRILPTLFWLNSSDAFLRYVCMAGAGLSVLLILGLAPTFSCFVLWFFYLSLFNIGQDFLGFQWDILLLETGFLAIFFTPLTLKGGDRFSPPSNIVLVLFWWLLFRLMFSSGYVKWASGDESWRTLTALNYHYETQPIPSPCSWFFHQLPAVFQKLSVIVMFFIELIVPFSVFMPLKFRRAGCACLIFLQVLIMVTGNYGFFNILAIALCLLLLDDSSWPRWARQKILPEGRIVEPDPKRRWPFWVTVPLAASLLFLSVSQTGVRLAGKRIPVPERLVTFERALTPFYLTGAYGLFAVMTTSRPEIIVEGSDDGEHWLEYVFKYKAGPLDRMPPFVAPHMPRLDWQMWFAALGTYQRFPWFTRFLVRLLKNSADVTKLLEKNPFPDAPPKYIRASLYDYRFTDREEKKNAGPWWKRKYLRLYHPTISLQPNISSTSTGAVSLT